MNKPFKTSDLRVNYNNQKVKTDIFTNKKSTASSAFRKTNQY